MPSSTDSSQKSPCDSIDWTAYDIGIGSSGRPELPPPLSEPDVLHLRTTCCMGPVHLTFPPYVGKLYVKGVDIDEYGKPLLIAIANGLVEVNDEHMPEFSIGECGFVREAWADFCKKTLTLWCRFTTDVCPVGARMCQALEATVRESVLNIGFPFERVVARHGGSEWNSSCASSELQELLNKVSECEGHSTTTIRPRKEAA